MSTYQTSKQNFKNSSENVQEFQLHVDTYLSESMMNLVALLETNKKCLLKAPTGSGKTVVAKQIGEILLAMKIVKKVVIAAPFTLIADSLGESTKTPYSTGNVSVEKKIIANAAPIHYCTYDSLIDYMDKATIPLRDTFFILDETHETIDGKDYREEAMDVAFQMWTQCKLCLGITGTPQPKLEALLEAVIIEVTTTKGVSRRMKVIESTDIDLVANTAMKAWKGGIVMIYINSISTIKTLEDIFMKKGFVVGTITSSNLSDRGAALKEYVTKKERLGGVEGLQIVLCTKAAESGMNILNREVDYYDEKDKEVVKGIDKLIYMQSAHAASPESIVQYFARCRKLLDAEVLVFLGKNKEKSPEDINKILSKLSKRVLKVLKSVVKREYLNATYFKDSTIDKARGMIKTKNHRVMVDNHAMLYEALEELKNLRTNQEIIEQVTKYNPRFTMESYIKSEAKGKTKQIKGEKSTAAYLMKEFPEECATLCAYTEGLRHLDKIVPLKTLEDDSVMRVKDIANNTSFRKEFECVEELYKLGVEKNTVNVVTDALIKEEYTKMRSALMYAAIRERSDTHKDISNHTGIERLLALDSLVGNKMSFEEVEKLLGLKKKSVTTLLDAITVRDTKRTQVGKKEGLKSRHIVEVSYIKTLEDVCKEYGIDVDDYRYNLHNMIEKDYLELFIESLWT